MFKETEEICRLAKALEARVEKALSERDDQATSLSHSDRQAAIVEAARMAKDAETYRKEAALLRAEVERLTGELASEAAAFKRVVWLEAELERCRRVVEAAREWHERSIDPEMKVGDYATLCDALHAAARSLDPAAAKVGSNG